MGLLDRIKTGISNAVHTATHVAEDVEHAVEGAAHTVAHVADGFTHTVDQAAGAITQAAAGTTPGSITGALAHTGARLADAVKTTVDGVDAQVDAAATAVSDAGHSVERAGGQLLSSGQRLVDAGKSVWGDVKTLFHDAGRLVGDVGQTVADAGRVVWHAGDGLLTGNPKELDKARAALDDAHARIGDAQASLDDAKRAWADVGTQEHAASSAIADAHQALVDAKNSVVAAGHQLKGAYDTLLASPGALAAGVKDALAKGGQELQDAVQNMPGGKDLLDGLARMGKGEVKFANALLHGDVRGLGDGLKQEAAGLLQFGKGAYDSPLGQFAKKEVVDYVNGFNIDKQVGELQPGETYTFKVGADAHAGVGGEARGALSVTKNADGSFALTADGAAGINGYLTPEDTAGQGETLSASARALLGGKGQFSFASPEEVQRATQIFAKAANATSVAGALTGPLPSADDLAFLTKHCTSIELSGKVAADAAAGLGLDGFGGKLGADLGIKGSQTQAVRIDLKDGVPVGIDLRTDLSASVSGGAGLRVPGKDDKSKATNKLAISGALDGTVSINNHYDLPAGLDLGSVLRDPGAALNKLAHTDPNPTTTVQINVQGQVSGGVPVPGLSKLAKGNVAGQLTLSGKLSDVLDPALISQALHGDLAGAAAQAGSRVTASGNVHTFEKKTWGVQDLGFTIADVGLRATFYAEKVHPDPALFSFTLKDGQLSVDGGAPPTPATADLTKALRGQALRA